MMNIDKIKKALNLAIREHNDLMRKADLPTGSKVFEEAIAELEKPTDGDVIVLAEKCLTIYEHESTEESCVRRISSLFQQYAESYHAKKCAECQKAKETL